MTKSALNPSELQFLLPESKTNARAVFGGAGLSWSVIGLVLALLIGLRPEGPIRNVLPAIEPMDLVYFQDPGSGGPKGGGGTRSPEPPTTSPEPAMRAIEPDPLPVATVDPIPEAEPIPIAQAAAITNSNAPSVLGPSSNTSLLSGGPGDGGGANGLNGPGSGPEKGAGPGGDRGGNKPLPPGPGITNPSLIASAKPAYTSEAMFRRIKGVVVLECVVERNGSVENCIVIRSLDSVFGLDEQAIKAARQFRFTPGRKDGQPVPVLVRIEITFNMQ